MATRSYGLDGRFGYRLKVPLALTGVALISGVMVALTTYALVDRHVAANAVAETQRLVGTLARALAQPVLRNDVWLAFQTLRAAATATDGQHPEQEVQLVVLDADGVVFASPQPRLYPIGQHMSALPDALGRTARRALERAAAVQFEGAGGDQVVLAVPIVGAEDTLLGVVLASHPRALTEAQRGAVVQRLILLGALAMVVVALAGGAIGLRMTAPLARLRLAMQAVQPRQGEAAAAVGASGADELAEVCRRRDEAGELGRAFAALMQQIAAQQKLERHMLEAERMASIGQLSAGIAHEVNNPLGGMLASIENRRLRGGVDESTERTLALLERGLRQIHDTVQALLNEARSESHPLTAADLHDLELLLRPEAEHSNCRLDWRVVVPPDAELPAVPVRQVLLNLTLNAIAAAGARGQVQVGAQRLAGHWQISVGNTGAALDEARLQSLTEGTERSAEGRLGLGLWITARLLHTLGGGLRLGVAAPPMATVLVAEIPCDAPSPRPN